MSTATTVSPIQREPELLGQTVVVIGGSAGIGLETARRARAEGAKLILTGRNLERLQSAASKLDALSTAAFDATDFERLGSFFNELPTPIDHVLVTGPGPYYARLAEFDFQRRAAISRPISCCRCRSLGTQRAGFAREEPCSSWAAPAAAAPRRDSR